MTSHDVEADRLALRPLVRTYWEAVTGSGARGGR